IEPALLRSSDYGVDFYGDTLFTTEAEIAAHPERVAAFVRASMKGWSYALQHSDELIESILGRPGVAERGITRDLLRQEAEVMRGLILPDLVELGHMNAMRWRRIAVEFAQQGLAPPEVSLAGFLWDPDPQADLRGLWWASGLAAAALLAFAIVSLWNVQMGRRVRARTAELRAEIRQREQAELELRASQERLMEQASLLDMARDAILVCDLGRVIRYWNLGAEGIYGWSAGEAIGRRAKDLLADRGDGDIAWAETLASGGWRGELHHRTRDGQDLLVESRWSLVRDESGRPKSVLEINTDVTASRRVAQQLLRAQRLESLGTLAGGIAHDINNLLAPILMGVELVRPEVASSPGREIVATIEQSARRGADLVRRLLTFSRGLEGDRIPLRIDDLVGELRAIVESTFPKQIELVLDLPADAWPVVGDPTQIGQVLLNLAVNARDAMPAGGRLSLRARNVTLDAPRADAAGEIAAGRYLAVEVADTGTGIAPE
ncbi:MAG: PAS domain-containing protein, partial [Thermoanaerobaculia bacterium]|nr:PAS domain-containing protein [Thermoanaerobaculia bacterium]